MDLVLYTIIRGLAIGILVSAPMGPIGVLCIQRTLNKGRWSGFVTGLGASISDLGYAVLIVFGVFPVSIAISLVDKLTRNRLAKCFSPCVKLGWRSVR